MNSYGSRRSLLEAKQLLLPVALLRITSSPGHSPDFDALLADICNTRDRQFTPYEVDYCRVSEDFSLNTTTVQPSFQVSCDILFLRRDIGCVQAGEISGVWPRQLARVSSLQYQLQGGKRNLRPHPNAEVALYGTYICMLRILKASW
ncbi:hypothetical protein F5879DRAFT_538064 [Lentinula edodes]|nr:hypothetical protein F5879DRAFT_538064 [Lentinula edodes]